MVSFKLLIYYMLIISIDASSHDSKPSNQCPKDSQHHLSIFLKHPPKKGFISKKSRSIVFFKVFGRISNRLLGYSIMLAIKRHFGLRTFLSRDDLMDIQTYFPRSNQVEALEDHYDVTSLHCEDFFLPLNKLNESSYAYGRCISFWPDIILMDEVTNNRFRWMDLLEKVEGELRETFVINSELRKSVDKSLHKLRTQYVDHKKKSKRKNREVKYVGIHVRKGDADMELASRYNYPLLLPSYYIQAMDIYSRHYKDVVVFIVSSNDKAWVKENLMPRKGSSLVFSTPSLATPEESILSDYAFMAACNATILSYGTFSFWSGWFGGGRKVLPNHIFRHSKSQHPLKGEEIHPFRLSDFGLKYKKYW